VKHLFASSNVESLFWLVMAVVWIVVQIVSRAAKKQLRRGAPPRPPSSSSPAQPDTSLENFLRSLGAEPELPPRPVTEPEAEPRRMVIAEPAPPVRTRRRKAPRPLVPAPSVIVPATAGTEPIETYHQVINPPTEADMARAGQRIRGMLAMPKIPVMIVKSLRVPGLVFRGNTINNRTSGSGRFPLKGRAALRQAILHRLILEPPHVFQV